MRYERRHAARPPASRSTAFAAAARKIYGAAGDRGRRQAQHVPERADAEARAVLLALFRDAVCRVGSPRGGTADASSDGPR